MLTRKFDIEGLLEIRPSIIKDERGFFMETYKESNFKKIGISETFLQDNMSVSKKGTFRGIHLQTGKSAQGKLVRVSRGSVIDFAVDLRPGSETYGKWESIKLTAREGNQFWIPAGFGHAFLALEDDTKFCYKCTKEYDKSAEESINPSDTDINLQIDAEILSRFNINEFIISNKDKEGITLKKYTEKYVLV